MTSGTGRAGRPGWRRGVRPRKRNRYCQFLFFPVVARYRVRGSLILSPTTPVETGSSPGTSDNLPPSLVYALRAQNASTFLQVAQRLRLGVQARAPPQGQYGVIFAMPEVVAIGHGNAVLFPQARQPRQQLRGRRQRVMPEKHAGYRAEKAALLHVGDHGADVVHAAELLVILQEKDVLFLQGAGEIAAPQQQGKVAGISPHQRALRLAAHQRAPGARSQVAGRVVPHQAAQKLFPVIIVQRFKAAGSRAVIGFQPRVGPDGAQQRGTVAEAGNALGMPPDGVEIQKRLHLHAPVPDPVKPPPPLMVQHQLLKIRGALLRRGRVPIGVAVEVARLLHLKA